MAPAHWNFPSSYIIKYGHSKPFGTNVKHNDTISYMVFGNITRLESFPPKNLQ